MRFVSSRSPFPLFLPKWDAPEEDYIYRSQAKNGTCSFFAYASIYIIAKNKRLTIAMIGVKKSYTSVAIITYLLEREFDEIKKGQEGELVIL